MRLRRHSAPPQESHGIDLAPMLDFVLNLLIFFIITAVFVKELGLVVNRSGGAVTAAQGGASSIPIVVTESGEVWVDGRVVDLRAVRANVERLHATDSKRGVLVIAHENAASGLVVEVVDQVRLGGVTNITFGTSG